MNEKSQKLFNLIYNNAQEIVDIRPSGSEYYFCFRSRFFSMLTVEENNRCNLIAYPKWRGGIVKLIELMERGIDSPETTYVLLISSNEDEKVRGLYEWLKRRETGLDQLFDDMGI